MHDRSMGWQTLRWLVFGTALIVVIVIAGRIWQSRDHAEEEAFRRAEAAADVMAESAARLFDAGEFLLFHAVQKVGEKPWDVVQHDHDLWLDLATFAARLPQLGSVWMLDEQGRARLSSQEWPTPQVDSRDRDYFRSHAAGGRETFVGAAGVGRIDGRRRFVLSRARLDDQGRFLGVFATSLDTAYFEDFAAKLGLDPRLGPKMGLLKEDTGERLFFSGTADETRQDVPRGILTAPPMVMAGRIDTGDALVAWRRLDGWPVVAAVGVQRGPVLEAWRSQAITSAILAGLALIALAGLFAALWREERRTQARAADADELITRLEAENEALRLDLAAARRAAPEPAGEGRG